MGKHLLQREHFTVVGARAVRALRPVSGGKRVEARLVSFVINNKRRNLCQVKPLEAVSKIRNPLGMFEYYRHAYPFLMLRVGRVSPVLQVLS